jgi:hypothetical protein
MPWLYADPDDRVCRLRGIDEDAGAGAGEGGGSGGGGGGAAGESERRFWDGSRDRWISVVSARVDPDVVRPRPVRRAPAPPRGLGPRARARARAFIAGRAGTASCADLTAAAGCGAQVTNQLGVLPRHEVQVPPGEVNAEAEANARCAPPIPTACCGRARGGAGERARWRRGCDAPCPTAARRGGAC